MTNDDIRLLTIQRDSLVEKLNDFESTNKSLRRLLQEQHSSETEQQRLAEQKTILINKFAACEEDNEKLRLNLKETDKQLMDLKIQLRSQTDEVLASATLQSSLEQTKAHLQRHLHQKEADCNRMAVQIRTLESELAQEKIEIDHLQELLRQAHTKHEKDKEALKKATRIQKQRATKSETVIDELNSAMLDKDERISELQAAYDDQKRLLSVSSKEKTSLSTENSSLKIRLCELEKTLSETEERQREAVDKLNEQLHSTVQQLYQAKSECERYKTMNITAEERVASLDVQIQTCVSEKRDLEKRLHEQKAKADRAEQEVDILTRRLNDTSIALDRVKAESSSEIERVRQRLEDRLGELEPLPEMLKTAELRLHDSHEKLSSYEKQIQDKNQHITDLSLKVERQANESDCWREKYKTLETSMQAKVEALERRLKETETKNTELLISSAQRDEMVTKLQYKLEERTNETTSLARQLENSLADSRRLTEDTREKAGYKERALQDKLRDLEEQLLTARADAAKARREKEESERRFNSKIYDLKDRLEQSHATNRSMQNYVHFLKSSYASVMGDVSTSSPLSPVRGSTPYKDKLTF